MITPNMNTAPVIYGKKLVKKAYKKVVIPKPKKARKPKK